MPKSTTGEEAEKTAEGMVEKAQSAAKDGIKKATDAAQDYGIEQAGQVAEALRAAVDQATQVMKDYAKVGGDWAQGAQDKALETASSVASDLRDQGGRAVGTVSRQVESNPMVSLAIAFAVGYVCAIMTRR